jgi:carbonic anhydrase
VVQFQRDVFPEQRDDFERLAEGQNPHTLFIACADSRVVPELITQTEPGELFVCRNIGNIIPAYGEMLGGVSAVVEYAVVALGVRHIVVCGHSGCGAMRALAHPEDKSLEAMPTVTSWLRNAAAARSVVCTLHPHLQNDAFVDALVKQNVLTQLGHLRTHPAVAARLAGGEIELHGWVYDIGSGQIEIINERTRQLVPVATAAAQLRTKRD